MNFIRSWPWAQSNKTKAKCDEDNQLSALKTERKQLVRGPDALIDAEKLGCFTYDSKRLDDGRETEKTAGEPSLQESHFATNECETSLNDELITLEHSSSLACYRLISASDFLLNVTIVTYCVIAVWRGSFVIVFELCRSSKYVIFVVGTCAELLFVLGKDWIARQGMRVNSCFVNVPYTYLFFWSIVSHWVCVWYFLDEFVALNVASTIIHTASAGLVLIMLKAFKNISGPPYYCFLDLPHTIYVFPTFFKSTLKEGAVHVGLYVLDCVFSVVVVGTLVVFVWRGVWTLTDIFLYPDGPSTSALSSLVIGYGVVLATFSLQAPMMKLCEYLTGFWRIFTVDIYIFISFIGTINLWRGIWMLLNIYFLPHNPSLSSWITHIFAFALLVLINCSNSVLVRGVYIDGEEEGGKCVDFPTYYLRMFFQEQRKKKLLKQSQRMRISTLANKTEDFEKNDKNDKPAFLDVCRNDTGKGHVKVELSHVTRF